MMMIVILMLILILILILLLILFVVVEALSFRGPTVPAATRYQPTEMMSNSGVIPKSGTKRSVA